MMGYACLALCEGVGLVVFGRRDLATAIPAAAFAALAGAVVVLLALPRWRDDKHSPAAGGLVFAAAGVVALVVLLLVALT
jgi:hypothetical protein